MSVFLPKELKEMVARTIENALSQHVGEAKGIYRVTRVQLDQTNVHVFIKSNDGGTYMLNISVKEVR